VDEPNADAAKFAELCQLDRYNAANPCLKFTRERTRALESQGKPERPGLA
jgi:hypothetical protein